MCFSPIDVKMWLLFQSGKRKNGHYSIGDMLDHLNLMYFEILFIIMQLNACTDNFIADIFANMCAILQFSIFLMVLRRAKLFKLAQSPDV